MRHKAQSIKVWLRRSGLVAATRLVLAVAAALILLAGCQQSTNVNEPPEIVYGQDTCDRCQMIINEENMAAAYWTADEQARRFDDIGGMFAYQRETEEEVATWWVHDYYTSAWLRAEDAYFVMGSGVMTPMGYGIVALTDRAAAETLAQDVAGAAVLDFSSLMERLATQSMNNVMTHDHLEVMDTQP